MPAVRPGGGQNAFKFQTSNNIWRSLVPIYIMRGRVVDFTSGSYNDCPDIDCPLFLLILEINGIAWTEFLTGRTFPLFEVNAIFRINGILQRHCLGILDIDRLTFTNHSIKFIGHLFRAFFRTQTAGNTFINVNISGELGYLGLKVTLFTGKTLYL
jgi:hypothetical protein